MNLRRAASALGAIVTMACCTVAQAATVTVTDANYASVGWTKTIAGTSTVWWMNGPDAPPLGSGSLQMNCPDGRKIQFATNAGNGLKLQDIVSLSYDTHIDSRSQGSVVAPALAIYVKTGLFSYKTLTFEPCYVGTTQLDTWQSWNALAANARGWWVSGNPNTFLTWAQVLQTYGTNTITNNGIWLQAGQNSGGAPWNNFSGYVDRFALNNTVFDFESSQPTPDVPEPMSMILGAMGLSSIAGFRRLRRK